MYNYFSIFPNPSKGVFNMRMAAINEFDYDLYDITGKLIYQERNIVPTNREYQLDLTSLSSGMYLLKIVSDGYQTTKKLILK